jgi:hypothetical protein
MRHRLRGSPLHSATDFSMLSNERPQFSGSIGKAAIMMPKAEAIRPAARARHCQITWKR